MKKAKLLLFILTVTLFSLVVSPGYEVFSGDHAIYMPQVYSSQNPLLFQKDLLISFKQMDFTLFDELINNFSKILHIDTITVLFILAIIVRFIYYYSIYKLALYFSNNQTFSFIATFMFMSGFNVYGYPYSTLETLLMPRSIAISLNLLFLVYFLNNSYFKSLIPLLLGASIHLISFPLFAIFFVLGIFLSLKKINYKYLFTTSIIAFFFLIFLVNRNRLSIFNLLNLNSLDLTWENILKLRNPYYYISNWNYQFFVLLGTIILFIIIFQEAKNLFKEDLKRKYVYLLFLIPLCLLFLYFLTVEYLNLHFFIQLQLLRNLSLWKIFSVLFFSFFAYKHIKQHPDIVGTNFFLIGIISSFIFENSFIYPLPNKGSLLLIFLPGFLYVRGRNKHGLSFYNIIIILFLILFSFLLSRILTIRLAVLIPLILSVTIVTLLIRSKANLLKKYQYLLKPILIFILGVITIFSFPKFKITPDYYDNKPFMEACDWIKNNTDTETTFITEPFSKMSNPLRLSCYRNIFTCRKDGSLVQFDRDYALEWKKRMDLVNELKDSYEILPQILQQYPVDYIFSDYKLDINKPEVFGNGKYFIYKIK